MVNECAFDPDTAIKPGEPNAQRAPQRIQNIVSS